MNKNFACLLLVLLSALLTACGPAAIVGALGTTITNAAYNEEERRLNDPQTRPLRRGLKVAIANLNLGTAYYQRGEYEKALDKLLRAQMADPSYPPVYNILGLLYQQLNEPERAEENFKKAIKLAPNDASNFNNYGLFLCGEERWLEAEQAFLTAAENPLYQSPELAYTNAGTCAMKNQDVLQAEAYFRKALDINGQVIPALIQMAQISYEQGAYLSAKGFLSRYLALTDHTPGSLLLGIQVEQQLGDRDKVASYSMLLRNKFPDTPEVDILDTMDI